MADTEGLKIPIDGDNRRFKKSLLETRRMLSGSLSVSAGSIGGLVTGAAFLRGVQDVRVYTDSLIDLATQTNLSVQTVQELSEVFARQGIEIGQASKWLDQMSKKLFEAKEGTGEAMRALRLMGVEASEFDGKNIDEQLQLIIKASKNLTAEQRRQVSFSLFGEDGGGAMLRSRCS